MNKKKIFFDCILIGALLLAALTAFLIIKATSKPGFSVSVSQNGNTVAEYSLSEDGEYSLADGKNILVIEGGFAYMKTADCPDGICVHTGKISMAGERIVCLPNRVMVEIKGN